MSRTATATPSTDRPRRPPHQPSDPQPAPPPPRSPPPMRYVVYGAGAVGGVIGGHLALAGRETILVARGEHLRRIHHDGLRLDTGSGVRVVEAAATDTASDVDWTDDTTCVLAGKAEQAGAAPGDIPRPPPPSTPTLRATNGVPTPP